jgi:hypothetical protein
MDDHKLHSRRILVLEILVVLGHSYSCLNMKSSSNSLGLHSDEMNYLASVLKSRTIQTSTTTFKVNDIDTPKP